MSGALASLALLDPTACRAETGEMASKETRGLQVLSGSRETQRSSSDLFSGASPVGGAGLGPTVSWMLGPGGSSLGALDQSSLGRGHPQRAHGVMAESSRLIKEGASQQPQWQITQICVPFSLQAPWALLEECQATPGLMG